MHVIAMPAVGVSDTCASRSASRSLRPSHRCRRGMKATNRLLP